MTAFRGDLRRFLRLRDAQDVAHFEVGSVESEPTHERWRIHYPSRDGEAILEDAEVALSVLAGLPSVDPARLGIAGHSYGGNTALFQAALDERVRYACTSGALCSFRTKMQHGTGIELSLAVPGLLERCEEDDLVRCCVPRPLLVVSGTEDEYARDAPEMVRLAAPSYAALNASDALELAHYEGGHALTPTRFERIMAWLAQRAAL